jgi:hypothetical protein
MSLLWSAWNDIVQATSYSGHAVYQLRYVDASGSARSIARFLVPDPTGVLYIGERANMEQARIDILTGIDCWDKHMAGIMIHILKRYSEGFRAQHSESRLQYRFEQHDSAESRKQREEQLIKAYVLRFGEVPPLNSAIPNRHSGWENLPGAAEVTSELRIRPEPSA